MTTSNSYKPSHGGYPGTVLEAAPVAIVRNADESRVARYLPSNFTAHQSGADVLVSGKDSHGWTLEGYVIPRLASGLIRCERI